MTQSTAEVARVDLAARVYALVDEGEVDPGAIATEVVSSLSEDELRPVVAQMMRGYVIDCFRRTRPPLTAPKIPASTSPATKQRLIRAAWEKHLDSLVHVGDGRWLHLGDCSVMHVDFLVRERKAHAEHELAVAGQYARLGEQMKRMNVGMVRELPADVLAAALEATA